MCLFNVLIVHNLNDGGRREEMGERERGRRKVAGRFVQ